MTCPLCGKPGDADWPLRIFATAAWASASMHRLNRVIHPPSLRGVATFCLPALNVCRIVPPPHGRGKGVRGGLEHRREDAQPIRGDLADVLRPWLEGKEQGKPVFKMPSKTAMMRRADLEAGRDAWLEEAPPGKGRKKREKTSFLKYRDASGRVADLHALRHTYISRLVRSGAGVKVAQELARHGEPMRITPRRPEAERGGRRQGGRSRQPVSGLPMQADAARGCRSRPKPEGYPDRLSPADAHARPLRPRPTRGPDTGAGCAAGYRLCEVVTANRACYGDRRRCANPLRLHRRPPLLLCIMHSSPPPRACVGCKAFFANPPNPPYLYAL